MSLIYHIFPILALIGYGVATFGYFKMLSPQAQKHGGMARSVLIFACLCHAIFLALPLVMPQSLHFERFVQPGFPQTLSVISCLLAASFILLEYRLKLQAIGCFIAPIAMLFMTSSAILFHLDRDVNTISEIPMLLISHIALVILANVLFIFSFVVSIAVIIAENSLKQRKFTFFQRQMPSLQTLDLFSVLLLRGGFWLMFIGVLLGFLFALRNEISFHLSDPRLLWSLVTLFVYAVVLRARQGFGWRGRRAAWLSVVGFGTIVCSFIGVNFLSGTFHVF